MRMHRAVGSTNVQRRQIWWLGKYTVYGVIEGFGGIYAGSRVTGKLKRSQAIQLCRFTVWPAILLGMLRHTSEYQGGI
jgi:hypothetical protein